jgi:tRNA uridine 5-carbamoylmethylation protein Kti12
MLAPTARTSPSMHAPSDGAPRARGCIMTLLLTGAPCAGKTETLHRLGDLLTRHGVRVVATPEVATELFLNERKLSAARFQQEVLERQLANEAAAAAQANY